MRILILSKDEIWSKNIGEKLQQVHETDWKIFYAFTIGFSREQYHLKKPDVVMADEKLQDASMHDFFVKLPEAAQNAILIGNHSRDNKSATWQSFKEVESAKSWGKLIDVLKNKNRELKLAHLESELQKVSSNKESIKFWLPINGKVNEIALEDINYAIKKGNGVEFNVLGEVICAVDIDINMLSDYLQPIRFIDLNSTCFINRDKLLQVQASINGCEILFDNNQNLQLNDVTVEELYRQLDVMNGDPESFRG